MNDDKKLNTEWTQMSKEEFREIHKLPEYVVSDEPITQEETNGGWRNAPLKKLMWYALEALKKTNTKEYDRIICGLNELINRNEYYFEMSRMEDIEDFLHESKEFTTLLIRIALHHSRLNDIEELKNEN